uniref:Uncharacterized protein n=2 Tax=Cacopsylla melanoneura TaxID=428564 RepID=A0A8D9FEG2_9HEMI
MKEPVDRLHSIRIIFMLVILIVSTDSVGVLALISIPLNPNTLPIECGSFLKSKSYLLKIVHFRLLLFVCKENSVFTLPTTSLSSNCSFFCSSFCMYFSRSSISYIPSGTTIFSTFPLNLKLNTLFKCVIFGIEWNVSNPMSAMEAFSFDLISKGGYILLDKIDDLSDSVNVYDVDIFFFFFFR